MANKRQRKKKAKKLLERLREITMPLSDSVGIMELAYYKSILTPISRGDMTMTESSYKFNMFMKIIGYE